MHNIKLENCRIILLTWKHWRIMHNKIGNIDLHFLAKLYIMAISNNQCTKMCKIYYQNVLDSNFIVQKNSTIYTIDPYTYINIQQFHDVSSANGRPFSSSFFVLFLPFLYYNIFKINISKLSYILDKTKKL